ncbi:hypothetical protein ABFS83_08G172600 [Erythranthe nasuta]
MAVDSHTLMSCGGGGAEIGTGHGGGDDQPAAAAAVVYRKGAWSKEEDEKLIRAVDEYGLRNWVTIERLSGLARPAKNCRLRWLNYLRPNLKKYPFTEDEERLILHLHAKHGNSWSRIAAKLPGRSDNEIKNFWHKRAKKCQKHHLPIYPNENHASGITDKDESVVNDGDRFFSNSNGDFVTQNSPQTPISISMPQSSQFLSSPSSLVTSQKHSPTNDQNTPTSQTPQNLHIISPHQTIQSTETPLDFTMLRKPPILSSPQSTLRRFSRSHSLVADSSSRAVYSVQTSMETKDSPMASFSPFQLKSPTTTAPLSPLQLRLSMPAPSESCFQSNLSVPDSTFSPCVQPMTVDTDKFVANNSPPPVLESCPSFKFYQQGVDNSGGVHKVEEGDSNLDVMEELREAQERVRFLKKKLKQQTTKNVVGKVHAQLKNSTKKEPLKRKGDASGVSQVKTARRDKGEDLEKIQQNENSESLSAETLQIKEDTLGEIFNEQSDWIDFLDSNSWDDVLCPIVGPTGKCSNESSTTVQDTFFEEDLFGQRYEIQGGEEFGYTSGQDYFSDYCDPNLISPNQYTGTDPLDSGYLLTQPTAMEQEPSPEQNLWTQAQMVSQDQTLSTHGFDSFVNPTESKNCWNNESGKVELKEEQEQDNMDTIMPDDLSSLLEFFPTNNQTVEWYNIGDAISISDYI